MGQTRAAVVASLELGGSEILQRSRWDIMARILQVARDADSKTHIMYQANLSYRQLDRYLDLLLEKGLLRVVAVERHSKATKFFGTTDKGLSFLKAYGVLKNIVRGTKGS